MKNQHSRILAWLLVFSMVLAMMPAMLITASADEPASAATWAPSRPQPTPARPRPSAWASSSPCTSSRAPTAPSSPSCPAAPRNRAPAKS